MSLLGKYLPHPPAGSGSWGEADEPLDAGRWTVLRQNAVFLARANASRHVATHEGVRDFYRAALSDGVTTVTTAPTLQQIPWIYTRKTGGAFLDFGVHWFHRAVLGETAPSALAPLGTLVLRARWKVEGGHTAGAVLAVSPGQGAPALAQTADSARTTTTSASWNDLTLTLPLTEALLSETEMRPAAGASATADDSQRGRVFMGRVFFGAYCSSGTNTSGNRASVVNISLHLAGST